MISRALLPLTLFFFIWSCEYERLELADVCSVAENQLVISNIEVTDSECTFSIGSISIEASGGSNQLEYRLNDGAFTPNPTFADLPAGNYRVAIRDAELGCELDTAGITVQNSNGLSLLEVAATVSGCNTSNGTISLSVSNEVSPVTYQIEGVGTQLDNPTFENLSSGTYTVNVSDAQGCEITTEPIEVLSGISFTNDVLPIIRTNCQNNASCHVSGGVSPNFDSEEVIVNRAGRIAARTVNKTMPPRNPLSDELIGEIQCWINEGASAN
ncbi:MAG: hypothetical protein AAGA66_20650 [Bacteroidota bacterium]